MQTFALRKQQNPPPSGAGLFGEGASRRYNRMLYSGMYGGEVLCENVLLLDGVRLYLFPPRDRGPDKNKREKK